MKVNDACTEILEVMTNLAEERKSDIHAMVIIGVTADGYLELRGMAEAENVGICLRIINSARDMLLKDFKL